MPKVSKPKAHSPAAPLRASGVTSAPPDPTSDSDAAVIKDHPSWKEGDFSLISSDGWRFRVRSGALRWASAILNDAVDASLVVPAGDARAEAELRFTDPDIENSEVLKIVLDLIMKGTMTLKSVNYPKCRRMCCAAAFLRKYECEAGLSTMKLVATNQLLLGGSVVPFYIFMLAAATDNVELSILCFKHRCLYEATDKAVAWHAVPGVDQIEFIQDLLGLTPTISLVDSLWPQALWAEIPFDYMSLVHPHVPEVDIAEEYEVAIKQVKKMT